MSMVVKPLKLNITMADIDPILAEIKANAFQEQGQQQVKPPVAQ